MSVRFVKMWLRKTLAITLLCVVSAVIVIVVPFLSGNSMSSVRHLELNSTFKSKDYPGNQEHQLQLEDKKVVTRRFPYFLDSACKNFSVSLYEDDTFEPVGLISFPGSGNTWTRHLIQLATGVYTGSFYFDIELFAGGFLGEKEDWYSGGTIVQKFHETYNPKMNIERAILLIREPFPAILSLANYLEGGHTGKAYVLPYHYKDWLGFLLRSAYDWLTLAKSWIESPVTLLVINFENLRLHPVENMRKICNFINHTCPSLKSTCFQRKLEGSFRRSNSLPSRRRQVHPAKYPTEIGAVIDGGIDHLNALLKSHGHDPVPLHLYQHYSTKSSATSR